MNKLVTMSGRPIAYLTRVEKFSACHRLHSVQLTDEQNVATYGKCNNANGHGHNYTLETTIRGPVDTVTGMVMNISDLKVILQTAVMDLFDHKHLDKDVKLFRDTDLVSTTENLAVAIFDIVSPQLPKHVSLHCIKLHETDKNVVEYRGERE